MRRKFLSALMIISILLTGCGDNTHTIPNKPNSNTNTSSDISTELNSIIGYTTEEDYNKSIYAKNHLSKEESDKAERATLLVASAIDPDPEWFMTEVDKSIVLVSPGDDYVVSLKKKAKDGTVFAPVDNDKLRLVIRIQRGKNDFENITNNDIDKYARWDEEGMLHIYVPQDLDSGRLLIGVRPNFVDVGTMAIAERWSTVIVAEVWKKKENVLVVDKASIIFPIFKNDKILFSPKSKFTTEEVSKVVAKQKNEKNLLLLPIIVQDMNIQKGSLISYILDGKPYSGKVFSVETRNEQQFALLTPEFFKVYDIVEAENNFLKKEGLFPQHLMFRQGSRISSESNEPNPNKFSKVTNSNKSSIRDFFDAKCEKGKLTLIIEPKVFLFPSPDIGLKAAFLAGKESIKCEISTSDKIPSIAIEDFFLATGGHLALIMKLFGTTGTIQPISKVKLAIGLGALGVSAEGSLRGKNEFKFITDATNILNIGSRDLNDGKSNLKIKIEGGIGSKIELDAISSEGYIFQVMELLNINISDLAISSTGLLGLKLIANMKNATKVLNDNESSTLELSANVSLELKIENSLQLFLSYFMKTISIPQPTLKATIEILKLKNELDYTFDRVRDKHGKANITNLRFKFKYLDWIFPQPKGVIVPKNEESTLYNQPSENIVYDVSECKNDIIEADVIACSFGMCGKVIKKATFCQPITFQSLVLKGDVNERISGEVEIKNNGGNDITVKLNDDGKFAINDSVIFLKAKESKMIKISASCPSKEGIYYGTTRASAVEIEPVERTSVLVCKKRDTLTSTPTPPDGQSTCSTEDPGVGNVILTSPSVSIDSLPISCY